MDNFYVDNYTTGNRLSINNCVIHAFYYENQGRIKDSDHTDDLAIFQLSKVLYAF